MCVLRDSPIYCATLPTPRPALLVNDALPGNLTAFSFFLERRRLFSLLVNIQSEVTDIKHLTVRAARNKAQLSLAVLKIEGFLRSIDCFERKAFMYEENELLGLDRYDVVM